MLANKKRQSGIKFLLSILTFGAALSNISLTGTVEIVRGHL
jgi:hypothetical protein